MNYNYNPTQMPNFKPMVFDPQFGYVEAKKLPLKKTRSALSQLSLAAICMLGASLVFSIFVGVFFAIAGIGMDTAAYPESGGIPPQIFYAMQMLMGPLATALPFVIYLIIKKEPVAGLIETEKFSFGVALMLIVAGGGLCLASNYPALLLGEVIEAAGLDKGDVELPPVKDLFSGICYFIGVAVMPAVFEEFAFRGVVLGTLKRYGKWFGLIVSSVIFGFMHTNATSILFATIAGFVMGYVYLLTKNIWVNIGIHFMNNAIAVILDIVNVNCIELVYTIVDIVLFYVPMLLAVAFIVILIVEKKLRLPHHEEPLKCSAGCKLAALSTSWGFISFTVIIAGFVVLGLFGVL